MRTATCDNYDCGDADHLGEGTKCRGGAHTCDDKTCCKPRANGSLAGTTAISDATVTWIVPTAATCCVLVSILGYACFRLGSTAKRESHIEAREQKPPPTAPHNAQAVAVPVHALPMGSMAQPYGVAPPLPSAPAATVVGMVMPTAPQIHTDHQMQMNRGGSVPGSMQPPRQLKY